MPSILIKGINVHRGSCWECPCLDGEYGECNVLKKDVHDIWDDECPLIELPVHGDLIDRDALKDKAEFIGDAFSGRGGFAVWGTDVINAPLVIPAERSEE